VKRNVLRRLNGLTAATRNLNSGRLEKPVPADGNDELSALGAALESFRQNALALRRNEHVLRERTRALEHLNRELDQFAYVASHDLKAPMRAIDSLAGFLREDLGEHLQGDSANHLDLMQGRIRRLEALLDSLLEYSRAGRERSPREVVDLRELIETSIDLVSPAGVQIRYSGEFGRVSTWRTPLEQIVRNLADNAFKHGDGELPFVTVECDVIKNHVRIVIADDGPGIAPEFHERIFGMFQTLQPRDKVEGSGMGLAILKKLIDTYDGSISIDSDPAARRGTSFTVDWPIDAVLPLAAARGNVDPVTTALARAS
jgi:signal transduction histidine kinase